MISWNKLLLITASAGLLTACGAEDTSDEAEEAETTDVADEPEEESEVSAEEEPDQGTEEETEEVVEEEEESVTEAGKRSNPLPMGESIQVEVVAYDDEFNSYDGKATISIDNVIRGEEAYNALIEMNEFNEAAPEGHEWVLFDASFVLDELETEDEAVFVAPSIKGFGSDGSQQPDDVYATTSPEFGWVDLYAGGSTEGKAAVLLPVDDEDALIEISDWEYSIFFDTK